MRTAVIHPSRTPTPRPAVAALSGAALLALAAAVLVIVFGVVATSGVYGSRMAWLAGVALPLLAVSMVLAFSAKRLRAQDRRGHRTTGPSTNGRLSQVVFVAAVVLFGIPLALAAALLAVDGLLVATHGIRLLF